MSSETRSALVHQLHEKRKLLPYKPGLLGQFLANFSVLGGCIELRRVYLADVKSLENIEDLQFDATCDDWPKPYSPELRIRRF